MELELDFTTVNSNRNALLAVHKNKVNYTINLKKRKILQIMAYSLCIE